MELNIPYPESSEVSAALGITPERKRYLLNFLLTVHRKSMLMACISDDDDPDFYMTGLLKTIIKECETFEESIFVTIKLTDLTHA